MIVIILTLLALSAVFNSQMDRIRDGKTIWFPLWPWWRENRWRDQPFWKKRFLYMLIDGWHYCKWVFLSCYHVGLSLLICSHYGLHYVWSLLIYAGIHLFVGILFNEDYHRKVPDGRGK